MILERLGMAYKDGVPQFGPRFEDSYEHGPEFRHFFLTKCTDYLGFSDKLVINAERAAYYAPTFSQKASRTRKALINEVIKKY